MKEKLIGGIILLVICTVANIGARYAFEFFVGHQINLTRPLFIGLSVACVMSFFKRTTIPTLPVWLGVGSFLGEIIAQIVHI